MLNLIILNESKVLKKSIWHMLCGATEVLLPGCEANKHCLERFACVGEEIFGLTHQALSIALLESSSTFKARCSQLWRFFIALIS